jgi:hypothetical protein
MPNRKTSRVSLEVMNPRGIVDPVPVSGLSTPRLKDLNGKRIALLSEKQEAVYFFDAFERLLRQKYPAATILRFRSAANPTLPDNTREIAEQCDVWLQGVKTSGSAQTDSEVKLEKLGKPGVTFTVDSLLAQRKRLALVNGLPTLRIITIPADLYLGAEGYPEKMGLVAASVFEAAIKALTSPLTQAEKQPQPEIYDNKPLKFSGGSYTAAFEKFQQHFVDNHMGDGLSLTPPTREAVKQMLAGTSRPPEEEIGIVPPRNGKATIEKIAVNAVMAGAKPEYFPVIITAVEGLTDPRFNLYHVQNSGASPVPLIWINGPITRKIGMNSGLGYLGYGNRANSTIGRAISLCLLNIGWSLVDGNPGLTGDPADYCCFVIPENEKGSPWESFAVEHGFKPSDNTVTAIENFYFNRFGPGGGMNTQTMEQSLNGLAEVVKNLGGSKKEGVFAFYKSTYCTITVYPAFAKQLATAGFTRKSLSKWIYDHTRIPWENHSRPVQEAVKRDAAAGSIPGLKVEDCQVGGSVPSFGSPEHIIILVAGDPSGYCVVWGDPSSSDLPVVINGVKSFYLPYITKLIRE